MVKIRLKRMGMKKMPFYRLVVTDAATPAMAASSRKWVLQPPHRAGGAEDQ